MIYPQQNTIYSLLFYYYHLNSLHYHNIFTTAITLYYGYIPVKYTHYILFKNIIHHNDQLHAQYMSRKIIIKLQVHIRISYILFKNGAQSITYTHTIYTNIYKNVKITAFILYNVEKANFTITVYCKGTVHLTYHLLQLFSGAILSQYFFINKNG